MIINYTNTITLLSILTCYLITYTGCQPSSGHVIIDERTSLSQPIFCLFRDSNIQDEWDIKSVVVWKVKRSSDDEDQPVSQSEWEHTQTVWELDYILKRSVSTPVSCVTYGEVPPHYHEGQEAVPLELDQYYNVLIFGVGGVDTEDRFFIIRSNATGTPTVLETH